MHQDKTEKEKSLYFKEKMSLEKGEKKVEYCNNS